LSRIGILLLSVVSASAATLCRVLERFPRAYLYRTAR